MDLILVYRHNAAVPLLATLIAYGKTVVEELGEPLIAAGFEKPWYGWSGLWKARAFAPDDPFFGLGPDE